MQVIYHIYFWFSVSLSPQKLRFSPGCSASLPRRRWMETSSSCNSTARWAEWGNMNAIVLLLGNDFYGFVLKYTQRTSLVGNYGQIHMLVDTMKVAGWEFRSEKHPHLYNHVWPLYLTFDSWALPMYVMQSSRFSQLLMMFFVQTGPRIYQMEKEMISFSREVQWICHWCSSSLVHIRSWFRVHHIMQYPCRWNPQSSMGQSQKYMRLAGPSVLDSRF